MNTFDKVILALKGATLVLTGSVVLTTLPKWLAILALAVNGACTMLEPTRTAQAVRRAVKAVLPATKVVVILLASLALSIPSCAFFQHPGPVMSCLETLGAGLLKSAIDTIYSMIDNGVSLNWTEAQIIAALEHAAIDVAPDVWNCAMLYVSNPQQGKPPAGVNGPKKASRSSAAAVAADYLAIHKS